MSLFTELKRRNVFRVAVLYAVTGWLIAQVADTFFTGLGLPAWTVTFVLALVILGFPVAVILAWMFEATPEGLQRDRGEDTAPSSHASNKLNWATLIVTGLAIALLVADRLVPEAPVSANSAVPSAAIDRDADPAGYESSEAAESPSIAVLPFADLSPDGDQAYFSEGIAEEILNVLAAVKGLRVASRTSSFVFRNEEKSIPVIAETLDVGHVLEGSVRKAGDRVRITAQLIRADSDAHLWSENFDRELSTENLFAIQDEIARAIVESLEESLGLDEPQAISVASTTDNLDAYELLLRAKSAASVMSVESEQEQLPLFERAVELDPEFAEAWAELASSLVHLPTWDHSLNSVEYRMRGRRAAERALELDPTNGTAWEALRASHFYLHEWEEADQVAEQARQANPDFTVSAAEFLGLGYLEQAREQADELIRTRVEDRGFWHLIKGLTFEAEGRYEDAIDPIRTAILNGYHGSASETLADIYLDLGRQDVWLMQHANHYRDNDPELIPLLPHLLELDIGYRNGDPQAARRFVAIARELGFSVDDLVQRGPQWGLRVPYTIASALGANAEIIEQYENYSPKFWMWTPTLRPFRRSEAFRAFVRERGLLAYWQTHGWPDLCRAVGENDFECD